MKLYEIDNAIYECVNEDGEVIDPKKLEELQMARDEKIESVACWIKDLIIEAEAIKAEKKQLAKRQKVAENKIESLKDWLQYALQGAKFKTARCDISFRKSESVEITPEGLEALKRDHDDLLVYSEPTPDKEAVKNSLKSGLSVPGVQLIRSTSTIIK